MQVNALNSQVLKGLRLAFIPAVAFLSAGGGVGSSSQNLGRILSLVGYIVFAAILITLIALEIRLWIDRGRLSAASWKVSFELQTVLRPNIHQGTSNHPDYVDPKRHTLFSAVPSCAQRLWSPGCGLRRLFDVKMEPGLWLDHRICDHGTPDGSTYVLRLNFHECLLTSHILFHSTS